MWSLVQPLILCAVQRYCGSSNMRTYVSNRCFRYPWMENSILTLNTFTVVQSRFNSYNHRNLIVHAPTCTIWNELRCKHWLNALHFQLIYHYRISAINVCPARMLWKRCFDITLLILHLISSELFWKDHQLNCKIIKNRRWIIGIQNISNSVRQSIEILENDSVEQAAIKNFVQTSVRSFVHEKKETGKCSTIQVKKLITHNAPVDCRPWGGSSSNYTAIIRSGKCSTWL